MHESTQLGTHYSWVPNLTGHLNFQFLTDNIFHEDDTHKIHQVNYKDKIKYFYIHNIDYSDNIDEDEKGLKRDILVRIEELENCISGIYVELLPNVDNSMKIEKCHKDEIWEPKSDILGEDKINWLESCELLILHAEFTVDFDGTIEIIFKKDNLAYNQNLGNVPLITYRAIKSILHKDVFHFSEDDKIINVSTEKHNHEFILKNMLGSLKAYERMIKDNLADFDIKGDYFEWLSIKVMGIHKYMNSYYHIFDLVENKSLNKILRLSDNIIDSINHMVSAERKQEESLSVNKELKILSITVFFSSAILISSLIHNDNKANISLWYISLAFISSLAAYIFFDGNILKRLTFNKYIKSTKGVKAEYFLKDRILGISAKKWGRRKNFFVFISILLSIILVGYSLFKDNILDAKTTFFKQNYSTQKSNNTTEHSKEKKIMDLNLLENTKSLNEENKTMGTEIHIHGNGHQINAKIGNNAAINIGTFGDIEEIVKLLKESNSTEFVELIEEGNKLVINSENNKSKMVNILDWATKITKIDQVGNVIVDKATLLIDSLKELL